MPIGIDSDDLIQRDSNLNESGIFRTILTYQRLIANRLRRMDAFQRVRLQIGHLIGYRVGKLCTFVCWKTLIQYVV